MLLSKPVLTVVVVLSLAMGIGANTAVFTLTKRVLLAVAIFAVLVPALRASRVDPVQALRAG